MSIAILPARLANQIAAGEVVERPASVIKELIENSLDAGATSIHIDVDKGGIKKIKITDNGHGIVKDELTLALSRHATSKIKGLNDLEAINSLGFRGEALASISSVSRLTLTSKPKSQDTAWQAVAEGRDMSVSVKPAAHPDGTSIEVLDLFFNTPARRKFLRTEKTEFNHIDEVVRRIALAHFGVSFQLTHNGNTVRQYRMANTQAQFTKRVAMVCGQKFIEHAVEVDCPHDNMTLSGWLAKPSFSRSQNDLCYSYVNGRMMRDKLINHAIRQAYADLLPADTYPAFVLFLQLDHSEVDVNVHPAKHEVRFHQSRYVHDFIYSVCHKALTSALAGEEMFAATGSEIDLVPEQSYATNVVNESQEKHSTVNYSRADYVKPLQHVSDVQTHQSSSGNSSRASQAGSHSATTRSISPIATANYQALMTPGADNLSDKKNQSGGASISQSHNAVDNFESSERGFFLSIEVPGYALYKVENGVRVLSLFKLANITYSKMIEQSWQHENMQADSNTACLISQPLLLPVMVCLSSEQISLALSEQEALAHAGIVFALQGKDKIQIRQFPALLREQDVSRAVVVILDELINKQNSNGDKQLHESDYYHSIGIAMVLEQYDEIQADILLNLSKKFFNEQLSQQLLLNSIPLDLTSHIKQLS
ncbi:MAG: DNA mismatch repair endonuclease MutL [Colwellia sp.]|nr:DNA mismatch repair endonuclease MutL [Colwellia sp.]